MSLFLSLVYPTDVWAAGNETVQIGNVEEDSTEKGEEGSFPSSDSEPEDVTLEDQETEESEVENQETEEPASEEQNADEDSSEEQLGEKIQKKQKVKEAEPWDFIEEHDLQFQYDDRYSVDSVKAGWKVASITTEEIWSNKVAAGENTGEHDTDVILCAGQSDKDLVAVGVGEAEILLVPEKKLETAREILEDPGKADNLSESIEAIKLHVTVKPARLTLMYVTGQSNASGSCSANSGYRLSDSVVCAAGEVYSTYVSTTPSSDSIAGVSFSEHCTADNASKFVAGSLRGNESISGNLLEYKLEALTSDGAGKTGPDSGLAYEWNRLTDDKVWVVNTAWGGSSINTWIPGGASYKTSMAVNKLVQ